MRLPTDITTFRFTDIYALNREIGLDVLQILILVQSDLHSAGARAGALHAVLVELDLNDVARTRHLLDCRLVRVVRQPAQLQLIDVRLRSDIFRRGC